MRIITAIFIVLVLLITPSATMAQETGEGIINGQVVNETENGGDVTGLSIFLITLVDETEKHTATAETDEEGKFGFTGLITANRYAVSVIYHEVDYYYPVVFNTGETLKSIVIPVCDATSSAEAISIMQAHKIISIEEDLLRVTEVLWLLNNGDRTYMGAGFTEGKPGKLVLTLPEGATDFAASPEIEQEYIFLGNNVVADVLPFPPGDRRMIFSYTLYNPSSGDYIFPVNIYYPTDSQVVMVSGDITEVASAQLIPVEMIDTGTEERFIQFKGKNLSRGAKLEIKLYGFSSGSNSSPIIIGTIAAIIVIVIITFWVIRIIRNRRQVIAALVPDEGDNDLLKQHLLQEILQLDADFKQGFISEDSYQQKRREKHAYLIELLGEKPIDGDE